MQVILKATVGAWLLLFVFSCAYFNTLYNARKIYNEAEETRAKGGSERALQDKYADVIKKCAQVVVSYPNSRWVDDAMFLMGQALIRQGKLDKGIRKFVEITTNFPESKYVAPSIYWLALAYYEKKDYNQALAYAEEFLTDYPKHDLRFEVMSLAGDIHRELEQYEEALAFYADITEGASRDFSNEAIVKSAELFFANKQWEEAALNYEKLLRKGLSWEEHYDISLGLAKCYTETGRCSEAMDIYNRLLKESVKTNEKPPILLGTASAHLCADSLENTIDTYKQVTKEFPKSNYSAEAFYRMGEIFHEKMDSLAKAQEAFARVGSEATSYEYASIALQKSNSLKRLIELQKTNGEGNSSEQIAEKKFLAAEIQFTRLNEIELAIENYQTVIDSFPGTGVAPLAAYAIAWIYHKKLNDREKALESYREIVARFPLSFQAVGAVAEIGILGDSELMMQMEAFMDSARAEAAAAAAVDSARADSSAAARQPGHEEIFPDSVSPDTAAAVLRMGSPSHAASDTILIEGAVADSSAINRVIPGSVVMDSTISTIDTVGLRERVRRETRYPLEGDSTLPDTLGMPPDRGAAREQSGSGAPDTLLPSSRDTAAREQSGSGVSDTLSLPTAPDSTGAAGRQGESDEKKEEN